MKLLLKLHSGRYNSSSLIPLQGNDSCWSYFQQEPILLHDREFAVVHVSLSAGLYLNFNASPISVSLLDKREDRSEKRERVWCIYSCLYLWSGAPRRPFDFTTLEFAGNKFSTGPFLLSSGYGMIVAQRNPRAVQPVSRWIGNIIAWLKRFTTLEGVPVAGYCSSFHSSWIV